MRVNIFIILLLFSLELNAVAWKKRPFDSEYLISGTLRMTAIVVAFIFMFFFSLCWNFFYLFTSTKMNVNDVLCSGSFESNDVIFLLLNLFFHFHCFVALYSNGSCAAIQRQCANAWYIYWGNKKYWLMSFDVVSTIKHVTVVLYFALEIISHLVIKSIVINHVYLTNATCLGSLKLCSIMGHFALRNDFILFCFLFFTKKQRKDV